MTDENVQYLEADPVIEENVRNLEADLVIQEKVYILEADPIIEVNVCDVELLVIKANGVGESHLEEGPRKETIDLPHNTIGKIFVLIKEITVIIIMMLTTAENHQLGIEVATIGLDHLIFVHENRHHLNIKENPLLRSNVSIKDEANSSRRRRQTVTPRL